MNADVRNIALCLLVPAAAGALAMPWAEAGCIDDFSYIHMAKTLAETGRFAYNGWPTAILGAQVWWGAAWVWLFGFSFAIVRASVIPLALGAVVLMYLIARRARLSPGDSLFVALLIALSTLFLPLLPTFMSDLPALFFLLASLLGFSMAADAADRGSGWRPLAWLAAGTCFGLIGGTIRQPVWFVPVACAVVLVVRRSGGGLFRAAAAVAAAAGLAVIVLGTRWFNRQPYAIPTRMPPLAAMMTSGEAGALLGAAVMVAAECAQKVLPAVLFRLPWVWRHACEAVRHKAGRLAAWVTAGAIAAVLAGTVTGGGEAVLSLLGGGWRPTGHLFHDVAVGVIRGGVLGLLAAVVLAAVTAWRHSRTTAAAGARLPAALILPLVAVVPYGLSLLLVSWTTGAIFPRYYLPILPAVAVAMLFATRSPPASGWGRSDLWPVLGWLLVGFFAARGVAIVHDEFADTRARLAAIRWLEARGVPRHRIASKWVIDGWVQIERRGYMNDSRIRVPADAYDPAVPRPYPDELFRDKLPGVEPDYIVASARDNFPGAMENVPRFSYLAWRQPPFRREIIIHGPPIP